LQGASHKKKFTGGKIKLAYIAGGISLLTPKNMKCFLLDLELHPLKLKILICVYIGSHCANIFFMVVGWRRWKREGEKI
jgi:hypothetical protein